MSVVSYDFDLKSILGIVKFVCEVVFLIDIMIVSACRCMRLCSKSLV